MANKNISNKSMNLLTQYGLHRLLDLFWIVNVNRPDVRLPDVHFGVWVLGCELEEKVLHKIKHCLRVRIKKENILIF